MLYLINEHLSVCLCQRLRPLPRNVTVYSVNNDCIKDSSLVVIDDTCTTHEIMCWIFPFQLILAGWLNGVGSLLRNVSTFDSVPTESRYTWLLAGIIYLHLFSFVSNITFLKIQTKNNFLEKGLFSCYFYL